MTSPRRPSRRSPQAPTSSTGLGRDDTGASRTDCEYGTPASLGCTTTHIPRESKEWSLPGEPSFTGLNQPPVDPVGHRVGGGDGRSQGVLWSSGNRGDNNGRTPDPPGVRLSDRGEEWNDPPVWTVETGNLWNSVVTTRGRVHTGLEVSCVTGRTDPWSRTHPWRGFGAGRET